MQLSRRIVVTPIAIFLSVAAFAWMWGAAATILAVPTLILFFAVARHVPPLHDIAHLLSTDEAALDGASEKLPPAVPVQITKLPLVAYCDGEVGAPHFPASMMNCGTRQ